MFNRICGLESDLSIFGQRICLPGQRCNRGWNLGEESTVPAEIPAAAAQRPINEPQISNLTSPIASFCRLNQSLFQHRRPKSFAALFTRQRSPFPRINRDDTFKMAAFVKAINAKIRSNKYTDYICSTRM